MKLNRVSCDLIINFDFDGYQIGPVDSEYYKRAVLNLFTDAHFAEPTHNIALLHEQEVEAAGSVT